MIKKCCKMGIYVAVIFLTLILGGVGGYILGLKQSGWISTQTTPPSPLTETSTKKIVKGWVTVDEISDEKKYTSRVLNFSIIVPKDWQIDDRPEVFVSNPGDVIFAPCGSEISSPYSLKLEVTFSEKSNPRFPYNELKTILSGDFQQRLLEPASSGNDERQYKSGNLNVGGEKAMQYVSRTLSGDPTGPFYIIVTWVQHNGLDYYFTFGPEEKEVINNLSVYNQIISSIEFTE